MIVTTDIGNILYRDCKAFGIEETTAGKVLEEIFCRSESMCTQFKRE